MRGCTKIVHITLLAVWPWARRAGWSRTGHLVPAIEERLVRPVHEKNSERVSQFIFRVIACVFVYLAYSSLEALYILSRLEPIAANLADRYRGRPTLLSR